MSLSRRQLLSGSLALVTTAAVPAAEDWRFLGLTKAVWVWDTTPDDWPGLEAFCRAQRIHYLALSLSQELRTALIGGDARVLRGLAGLRNGGTAVQALSGEQDWITRRQTSLPRSLSEILEIQQRQSAFNGLHLDIEPQLLAQWKNGDRSGVGKAYVDLLTRIRSATSGQRLEVTVHPNYAGVQLDGQSLLQRVVQIVDGVSLMAYRDKPSDAVRYAGEAISTFKETGCSWRFGVLVNASREAGVTYFGTSAADFRNDMVVLDSSLRQLGTNGFAGLIFEDYRGLRQILAA